MQPCAALGRISVTPSGTVSLPRKRGSTAISRVMSLLYSTLPTAVKLWLSASTWMDVSAPEPENAPWPRVVRLAGSRTLTRLEQSAKAPEPMDSTPSGTVTRLRPLPAKASAPMAVTVPGMNTEVRLSFWKKTLSPMAVTVSGMMTWAALPV